MQRKKISGEWQKRVQKVLLKRCLRDRNTQRRDTVAKTAETQPPSPTA